MLPQLIMIDGIPGSGKSSTAQYISKQLNDNGMKAFWYHEEEANHPLDPPRIDPDSIHSPEEVSLFINTFLSLLQKFVQSIQTDRAIHIIESYYFQNSLRILFQNDLAHEEMSLFFHRMNAIIQSVDPLIVYFHHDNVEKNIQVIWDKRGEKWKKWFIATVTQAPYLRNKELSGEEGVITFWREYQRITDALLDEVSFPVVRFEGTDQWSQIHEVLCRKLGIRPITSTRRIFSKDVVGTYRYNKAGATLFCHISIRDNVLYWDFFSDEVVLFPQDEKHCIPRGLPISLEFQKEDGVIQSFEIKGKDIYGLLHTIFVKS